VRKILGFSRVRVMVRVSVSVWVSLVCTGWRRINRTIQPFNRVYENLHKISSLVFVQPGAKFDSSY